MNAVKERIFGAVTIMPDAAASRLWDIIVDEFSDFEPDVEAKWAAIPEIAPDEFDLQMLKEIEENPDSHEFIPASEVKRRLGLA